MNIFNAYILDLYMKDFFLNFTKILESNSKIYWSIIIGIAGCLILYIAEIVHIQNVLGHLNGQESSIVRAVIDPIAQKYQWSRIIVILFAIVCSVIQYYHTKKNLNL